MHMPAAAWRAQVSLNFSAYDNSQVIGPNTSSKAARSAWSRGGRSG